MAYLFEFYNQEYDLGIFRKPLKPKKQRVKYNKKTDPIDIRNIDHKRFVYEMPWGYEEYYTMEWRSYEAYAPREEVDDYWLNWDEQKETSYWCVGIFIFAVIAIAVWPFLTVMEITYFFKDFWTVFHKPEAIEHTAYIRYRKGWNFSKPGFAYAYFLGNYPTHYILPISAYHQGYCTKIIRDSKHTINYTRLLNTGPFTHLTDDIEELIGNLREFRDFSWNPKVDKVVYKKEGGACNKYLIMAMLCPRDYFVGRVGFLGPSRLWHCDHQLIFHKWRGIYKFSYSWRRNKWIREFNELPVGNRYVDIEFAVNRYAAFLAYWKMKSKFWEIHENMAGLHTGLFKKKRLHGVRDVMLRHHYTIDKNHLFNILKYGQILQMLEYYVDNPNFAVSEFNKKKKLMSLDVAYRLENYYHVTKLRRLNFYLFQTRTNDFQTSEKVAKTMMERKLIFNHNNIILPLDESKIFIRKMWLLQRVNWVKRNKDAQMFLPIYPHDNAWFSHRYEGYLSELTSKNRTRFIYYQRRYINQKIVRELIVRRKWTIYNDFV